MPESVVWRPSPERIARSRLQRFLDAHGLADVEALRARSAADPAWFWEAVLRDLEWAWSEPPRAVLELPEGPAFARWFPGGRCNLAHNAVERHLSTARRLQLALVWEGEDGAVVRWTYRDLWREVCRLAGALADLGVGPGVPVGCFLPMLPEAAATLLACAHLGAVFVPLFSGYGAEAAATRLADVGARVVVTADGFYRRGRVVPLKQTADAASALAGCVQRQLVVRRLRTDVPWREGRDLDYAEAVRGRPDDRRPHACASDDPWMIIYTSGTSGRPKGAVHVHPGFPVKSAQDLAHCFDLQPGDLLFWFTDMGWMMGPWEVCGSLLLGATMLLYEGTPDHPDPGRLWSLVERHGVTHLGVSPTVVRAAMAHGPEWVRRHDLSSLYVLGSTGEPWNPEPWRWFFEEVGGGRCPVINYSGGTEIGGGILGGFPHTPLAPCAFGGPIPGVPADVLDEEGRPVRGRVGELCLLGPWVGMTQGFWRDRERYLDTYWSRWPGVWVHGDWARVDEDGFWYIEGRSDDTLKVAGKRVGPAELESALVSHPAVREAVAVGVPHPVKGEAAVLFAILRPGFGAGEDLRAELRDHVAARLGAALRPEDVRFADDIPRTRNGKLMRRVVRAAWLGLPAGDVSALENPQAVEAIRQAR
jgi:acetyl-CoA synthetase